MIANALRKIALPASIAIFCVLFGANAYLALKNFKVIQNYAALRSDATDVQSGITALDFDLQHVVIGQRGFLLTGDDSYLAPYTDAVQKLPKDFSALRSHLVSRPARERTVETELEAVTASMLDDADQTIRLRQKGYRHRAFLIVNSNRGRDLMAKARALLDSLSTVESRNIAQYQQQFTASTGAALRQVLLANFGLLAVAVLGLVAFDFRGKRLEGAFTRQAEALRATSNHLERLTSTLSNNVRTTLLDMQAQAENLLNVHAGFLPHQGQEGAEWIYRASRHVNLVIGDLLQPPVPSASAEPADFTPKRDSQPVEFPETPELPKSHTA